MNEILKLRDMKVLLYWTVIEVGMGQATKKSGWFQELPSNRNKFRA